jgi:hypothetical protein
MASKAVIGSQLRHSALVEGQKIASQVNLIRCLIRSLTLFI